MKGIQNFPPVLRRKWIWGVVVAMAVPLIELPILLYLESTGDWIYLIAGLPPVASALIFIPLLISGHRVLRRGRDHDFKLCIHCGHLLEGLPDAGTCPECGKKYTKEECQARWRAYAGHWPGT